MGIRADRRGVVRLAAVVALLLLVALAAGCIDLITAPTGVEAGPQYTITLQVHSVIGPADVRGTLAFRHPAAWEVVSVTYGGSHAGALTPSSPMALYFATTWEAAPVNSIHNGPKAGYEWWAGFSPVHNAQPTDAMTVTIVVNTNGVGGSYLLDFVTGQADDLSPEDPAENDGGASWESGGLVVEPPGVVLDHPVTLTDAVLPTVISTTPANGAEGVPLATDPKVRFSEDMNQATATNVENIYVRKSGALSNLPATLFYNAATDEVTVDLNNPLEYGTDYLLVIREAVKDEAGNPLASDLLILFSTPPEPLAPEVIGKSPVGSDVALQSDVTAIFDIDMQASSINADNFYLARQTGPATWVSVPATVSYSAATRTAILNPSSGLLHDSTYRATLTTGIQAANGVSLPVLFSWQFTTEAGAAFIDVDEDHPYFDAIQGMYESNVITGYLVGGGPEREFRPDNPVWRWQFAKMICGALNLPVTEDLVAPFPDLGADNPAELYPHDYVARAYLEQIIKGYPDGTFRAFDEIRRAHVITMVVRALQRLHPDLLQPPAPGFTGTWGVAFDKDHGPNARLAEANGLMAGLPLSGFAANPWAPMPRGEVAQVLWNMMKMLAE